MASSGSTESMGNAAASSAKAFESEETPRVLGRYMLLRRLARGGMGEVFLATTTGLEGAERAVVVKIIRREHAKDPSFIARFLDEARVQAQLQHSGVAQVLDAAIDDRTSEPYAVVEHVEGRSLGDVRARAMQAGKTIGWADAVAVGTLIAEALAHVHERKDPAGKPLAIVHRDLSPQNVMVSYTGECKIIDFGTARGQNRRCHTVAGVVFAKPGYVAPEVANGDSGDARVDLYALGVMLWELCAGRRFLQGDSGVHMAAVARNEKNLPPVAQQVGAPVELDAIIAKLTAHNREDRYAPGPTAAADLARLLAAESALPNGERGVRARTAHMMRALFPGELEKSRRDFAGLLAEARVARGAPKEAKATPAAKGAASTTVSDEGQLPGTRYRIVRELGRGESSIVYEVEHLDLGSKFAVKVITGEHSRSPEFARRFRREARVLSRLAHEGLATIHDVGQTKDGRLFCVMELLEGETLEAFLAREKGVDWREALSLASRALCALEVTHAAGLVHRDLKPANLFLTTPRAPSGGLRVLDFGLARGVEEPEGGSTEASSCASFTLFGTPEYMAPEQAASGQIDARADLYALGCVLYEMLTGRLPFVGPSSVAILDAKIKGNPERPCDRAPTRQIPLPVDDLVCRALARHPSMRFQTATEMRIAIDTLLQSPAKQRAGRRALAASTFAALAVLVGLSFTPRGKQLRAAVPWSRMHLASARVATTIPTASPVPAAETTSPAPVTVATLDPDGFDEGDDGDFVDDVIPGGALADAQPKDAATKGNEPAPTADEPLTLAGPPAPPAKVRSHKRGGNPAKASSSKAIAAQAETSRNGARAEGLAEAVPSDKRRAGTKTDKAPRRRHKSRVAEVL